MARASGSYPAGRWFKSDIRYHSRPGGQEVKTRPFHGCNMGSIPVRVTIEKRTPFSRCPFFYVIRTQDRTHSRRPCASNMGSKHCSAASVSEALSGGQIPVRFALPKGVPFFYYGGPHEESYTATESLGSHPPEDRRVYS